MGEGFDIACSYVNPFINVNSCLMVPPCCLALSLALKLMVSMCRKGVEVLLTFQAARVRLPASK